MPCVCSQWEAGSGSKRFGDVGAELRRAATAYADEVASGAFPAEEHSF